jgi:hypothetical protein
MFKYVSILVTFVMFGAVTAHADIVPVYSQYSVVDAANQCNQQGQTLGLDMSTVTATGNQFYIVACARPDGDGGTTYVPAWSASSFVDADNRCEAQSATTGLAGGYAVGQPLYVNAQTTDIFVVLCNMN